MKLNKELKWKFNRLQQMSLREIAWRFGKNIQMRLESTGYGLANPLSPICLTTGRAWLPILSANFDKSSYTTAADKILHGFFNIFAINDANLGFPPNYNCDPKTGKIAPLSLSTAINFHDESLVGNIKYLWEINRHLELLTLAQAYYMTEESKYAFGIYVLLDSWLKQCPYLKGPNWSSSLELAIRLVNWAFVWHLLGGDNSNLFKDDKGKSFKNRWINSIYQHCHFIFNHFSRFSSSNNHFLGENMGLFVGTITWPFWKESHYWRLSAFNALEIEAQKQIAPDGVNREQSIWYQHEVADMMIISALFGRANGLDFSKTFWQRLEGMLEFFASLMDVAGNLPMIGDADDGIMVRFTPSNNFNVFKSLLATGAVLFNRYDFKLKAFSFDDKSRWLLGDSGAEIFSNLNAESYNLPVRQHFPHGGYYILGENYEDPNEIRIIVDSGPLGYLSIAAHGHADALSICLSLGGTEFLIDPGTFSFNGDLTWRYYFKGTSAHNTLRVDKQDQSSIAGKFLWKNKAKTTCLEYYTDTYADYFSGFHDGYCRLKDPVVHNRDVHYLKSQKKILISDKLSCKTSHIVERFWHFSENIDVIQDSGSIIAKSDCWLIKLTAQLSKKVDLYFADQSMPLGWVSRKYDQRAPCATAVFTDIIHGSCKLDTIITINYNDETNN